MAELYFSQETAGELEDRVAPPCGGVVPAVHNIVSSVYLGCKLELKRIALRALNAVYNPRRFPAVVMRIREPRTTALIYASGRVIVTGAKTDRDSRIAARKFARIVQKLGFDGVQFKNFKILNMVALADVKFTVRLELLEARYGGCCTYEPEFFPGLFFRMRQPKVSLLIFASGKVIIVGAKTREDVQQAFRNIYPVVLRFKKAAAPPVASRGGSL